MDSLRPFDTSIKRLEELDNRKTEIIHFLALRRPAQNAHDYGQVTGRGKRTRLIEEHNKIVENQANLQPSPFLFPTETIIECFQYAIKSDPNFVYKIILLNQY
jgi:hypothetical protein